jgi:RND family efflux transporter MFP subunit
MSDRKEQLESLSIDRDDEGGGGGISIVAVLVIIVISLALGASGAWYFLGKQDQATPQTVTVAQQPAQSEPEPSTPTNPAPSRTPRASGVVASGYVVARRQATISAEITGRIREVLVEEGTVVETGQVVSRLDDTRARIQLDLLQAQVNASNARIRSLVAQIEEARRVQERALTLAEREIGSEANATAARSQVDSLQAQLDAARSDLAAARVQVRSQQDLIERHVVRAPFPGVVIAKNAQVGEILSPASAGGGFTRTGVATLVDMASLEIEVDVNEGQINRITPGQRVEARLDAYPDWRIPSRVEAIIPTADRSRATIRVRVAFEERDERILPDMAARVTFVE